MHGQDFRTLINTLETVESTVNITEQWNKWNDFLKEAETKAKTKTKIDPSMFKGTDDSQMQAPDTKEQPKRKRAKQVTLNKAVPMPDLDRIERTIGKSDTDDDYGELEMNAPRLSSEPTLSLGQDTDTDTTDMAINAPMDAETKEIAQRIHNVEWNNMMDLPGNMHQMIRNMGRRVFNAFGEQEFEDIDVIASITNSEEDLDAVAGLVRQFGVPIVQDNIVDFGDTMPGYKAYVGVWGFANQYYMFVKDDHGEYIYTWDNRTTNKLQHMEPMGNNSNKPLLNDIHEDTVSRVHFHNINDNPLHNKTYKGYKYLPNPERDEEGFDKLHHDIETPSGDWFSVAPDWFKQISPYKFPTAEEFKRAVDEISGN